VDQEWIKEWIKVDQEGQSTFFWVVSMHLFLSLAGVHSAFVRFPETLQLLPKLYRRGNFPSWWERPHLRSFMTFSIRLWDRRPKGTEFSFWGGLMGKRPQAALTEVQPATFIQRSDRFETWFCASAVNLELTCQPRRSSRRFSS